MEMRDPSSSNYLTTSIPQHQTKDRPQYDHQNRAAVPSNRASVQKPLSRPLSLSRPTAPSATAARSLPSYTPVSANATRRNKGKGSGRVDLSQHSDESDSESSGIFINELIPKSMIEAHIAAEDKMASGQGAHY